MPEEPSSGKAVRFVRTVPPEVETLVSIQVAPESVCYLSHPRMPDQRMQLDADDNGIVRFHAKALRGAEPIEVELKLQQEDGRETVHTIALSGDTMNAPQEAPQPEVSGQVRPPLEGDPMALSNQELVRRGYPPRPDPVKAPAHYARWLKNVSQQFSVVNRKVAHPDVSFARQDVDSEHLRQDLPPILASPTLPLPPPIARTLFNSSSNNWSGAYLTQPANQFDFIQAQWIVPRVFSQPDSPQYSAVGKWVGLDSSGTDLFQSGTDSECLVFPLFGWTFTNYWMWIETLPFDPWGVPFPVSPGDTVSVTMFLADQYGTTWFKNGDNGGLTAADNYVWFMLYNETQNHSFWGTLPTSPQSGGGRRSTGFTGTTAEFILERPTINKVPVPLALFLVTYMDGCWYGDSEYGNDEWQLGANGSTPFVGNLTYINMVDQATGNLLAIPVSVPDPNSGPESYQIVWWWVDYL